MICKLGRPLVLGGAAWLEHYNTIQYNNLFEHHTIYRTIFIKRKDTDVGYSLPRNNTDGQLHCELSNYLLVKHQSKFISSWITNNHQYTAHRTHDT